VISNLPDELMRRVQLGDHDAFSLLYDLLAPSVFGVVRRVVRDTAISEEVFQEVFVEIWRTAGRFDASRASVVAWAVTMARRRAIDRVRKEQSQRNRVDALAREPVLDSVQPDEATIASLDSARMSTALAQLPHDQREAIQLAFIDGHAHGAVAEILGIPLGTVKGRIRSGLRRLRATIGE
jgi:RNA polymerase sigma-70 factor, ECF subfamily